MHFKPHVTPSKVTKEDENDREVLDDCDLYCNDGIGNEFDLEDILRNKNLLKMK